jgi:hypothetical protein
VSRRPLFVILSTPVDTATPHICSLGNNQLCGLDYMGDGTYTSEGITKLCEALKGSAVTSLRYGPALESSPFCQHPLTCLLPSYRLCFSPHPHTSFFAPFPSLPPCFLHPFCMDRGHVLVPDRWITRAPVYPPHPLATSPSQLGEQRPRRPGQAGHQRCRGQRRLHRPVS